MNVFRVSIGLFAVISTPAMAAACWYEQANQKIVITPTVAAYSGGGASEACPVTDYIDADGLIIAGFQCAEFIATFVMRDGDSLAFWRGEPASRQCNYTDEPNGPVLPLQPTDRPRPET